MSLPPDILLELMAFADGELQGEARERLEKIVAESEDARRVVEAIRSPMLGSLIAEAMSDHASAADGIADAVMSSLERKVEVPPAGPAKVIRLADIRPKRSVPRPVLGASLVILGAAAAVALYLRSSAVPSESGSTVASVGGASVDVQAPPAFALGARPAEDVEVEQVESSHDITLFSIPLGGAAAAAIPGNPSTVVIMIEDDPPQ